MPSPALLEEEGARTGSPNGGRGTGSRGARRALLRSRLVSNGSTMSSSSAGCELWDEAESSVKDSRESHLWCSRLPVLRRRRCGLSLRWLENRSGAESSVSTRPVHGSSPRGAMVGTFESMGLDRAGRFVLSDSFRASCNALCTESGVKGGVRRPWAPSAKAACGISGGRWALSEYTIGEGQP